MQTRATLGTIGHNSSTNSCWCYARYECSGTIYRRTWTDSSITAAQIKYYIDYLAAYGINAVHVLTKVMGVAVNISNLKTLIGGLAGNIPDIQTINTDIQNVQQKKQKADR